MFGFKVFDAAVTISGVELLHRIHKGRFKLARLRLGGPEGAGPASATSRDGLVAYSHEQRKYEVHCLSSSSPFATLLRITCVCSLRARGPAVPVLPHGS